MSPININNIDNKEDQQLTSAESSKIEQNPQPSLGGDKGVIVINHVPFSQASVEVITVRAGSFPNRELNHVERDPVMSRADDTIAVRLL